MFHTAHLRNSGPELINAKRILRQYVLGHVAYGDPALDYAVQLLSDLDTIKNKGKFTTAKV